MTKKEMKAADPLYFIKMHRDRRKKMADEFSTLTADEKLRYIPYPGEASEFEIQAYLFHHLNALGFDTRGEISSRCATCIFDLVVYLDRKPIRIIEVKRSKAKTSVAAHCRKVTKAREKQLDRYGKFGVPVDSVVAMREAKIYVDIVREKGLAAFYEF